MSYILDALKKSDQERQQEDPPHLHSLHGYPPVSQSPPFQQSNTVRFLLLGALLSMTCFGFSYYWYQHNLSSQQQSQITTPPPPQQPVKQIATPSPPPVQKESPIATPAPQPPAPITIARDKGKIMRTIVASDALANPIPAVSETVITPKTLPYVKELPSEVQQNIPKLKLSGHTFSKSPEQRMIIINNKILREGDNVDGNIRLEEITWEGVILNYKGTRFQQKTD